MKFNKNNKQIKKAQNAKREQQEKQEAKEDAMPTVILRLNPKTGTVDIGSNHNLGLATVRGFIEEADDNIKSLNAQRWHREQILVQKTEQAERAHRAKKWNDNEKAKLRKDIKNK